MSNAPLNRLLRGGGLTSFHVGAGSVGRDVARETPMFNGERFTFSNGSDVSEKQDFSKKENREESGSKKLKESDAHSDSDSDGGDADGDGKKNEGTGQKSFEGDNNHNKSDLMKTKR